MCIFHFFRKIGWIGSLTALLAWTAVGCEETIVPDTYGVLRGEVRDFTADTALPEAIITTEAANAPFLTDSLGTFCLAQVRTGSYGLSARKTGYRMGNVNFTVTEGDTTALLITMEAVDPDNAAPEAPQSPYPADQATDLPIRLCLRWTAQDPDPGDSLRYTLTLLPGGSQNQTVVLNDAAADSLWLENLAYDQVYYWQVEVRDAAGLRTKGPIWSFRTQAFPLIRMVMTRAEAGLYVVYGLTPESAEIPLTSGASSWFPRLAPDREAIALARMVGAEPYLFLMNRDGSDLHQLSTLPLMGNHHSGRGLDWSPGGEQLAFSSYDRLYRINRDGSGPYILAQAPAGRHFRGLSWRPQGDALVVETVGTEPFDTELYQLHLGSGALNLLVANTPGITASPAYTPDGLHLLYTHDASGLDRSNGRQFDARIYRLRLSDSTVTDLSHGKPAGTNDLYPRPSPTGAQLIFVHTPNDGLGPDELWIMDMNGNNRQRLTPGTMPDWR